MADLPVEIDAGTTPSNEAAGPGGDFLRGYATLPIVRQLGLMLALAATVAVGVSVVLWMREPDYKPLTGIGSVRQANAAAEALQAANIPYRLDDSTGMLMVPAEVLHQARMKIAGVGGLSGDQEGFELLDKDQGFGVSQFMETNMFRRSLEGELARSITSINSVQHARVHLAIPKSTAFLRDQRAPTASVTVGLAPGQSLSFGQVRAIMNLVAGAVSELTADHVTVVDQTGQLLSGQEDDTAQGGTDRQFKYVQQLETSLREKVHNILLPTVGANRFTAEVAADVDFTWVEETEELFNPDQPALRSEQTLNEQRVGEASDGGVPGRYFESTARGCHRAADAGRGHCRPGDRRRCANDTVEPQPFSSDAQLRTRSHDQPYAPSGGARDAPDGIGAGRRSAAHRPPKTAR